MKRVAATVCFVLLLVGAAPVQATDTQTCTDAEPCEAPDDSSRGSDTNSTTDDQSTDRPHDGGKGGSSDTSSDCTIIRKEDGGLIPFRIDPEGCLGRTIERLLQEAVGGLSAPL